MRWAVPNSPKFRWKSSQVPVFEDSTESSGAANDVQNHHQVLDSEGCLEDILLPSFDWISDQISGFEACRAISHLSNFDWTFVQRPRFPIRWATSHLPKVGWIRSQTPKIEGSVGTPRSSRRDWMNCSTSAFEEAMNCPILSTFQNFGQKNCPKPSTFEVQMETVSRLPNVVEILVPGSSFAGYLVEDLLNFDWRRDQTQDIEESWAD